MLKKACCHAVMAQHNRFGAPYWCNIVSGLAAMAVNTTRSFTTLAAISAGVRFTQYIPTCLAVMVFRRTKKDIKRSFKIPFGNTIPILAILISIVFFSQLELRQIVLGFGAIVIAIPFYFIYKLYGKKKS